MKFCYNCGAKIEEGSLFCSSCGAKQSVAPTPAPVAVEEPAPQPTPVVAQAPQPAPQPELSQWQQNYNAYLSYQEPKKKKTAVPFIVIGVIVAVIALSLLISVLGRKSYDSAFDTLCVALNEQDMDKMFDLFPPGLELQLHVAMIITGMGEEEFKEEVFGYMSDEDYEVEYDIEDAEKMSSSELEYCQEMLDSASLIPMDKIKEGYIVDVTLTTDMGDYEYDERMEMLVVRVGNRWCLLDILEGMF